MLLLTSYWSYEGWPPKNRNLFIKICVFILTRLNFSHLQSTLHLMQYSHWDVFPLLKTVFKVTDMPFSASAIFCFTYSTLAVCFPLRTFFIQWNQQNKKAAWGKIRWIGRWGTEVMLFLVKNCWTLSTMYQVHL